jgi:predicted phosphodiesterase
MLRSGKRHHKKAVEVARSARGRKRVSREERYRSRVAEALEAAYARAERQPLELNSGRLIVFSDHHRGARNRADDFLRAERAYNAALAWYHRLGYTLVVLGDAEELWQERPMSVLKAYAHCLSLEAKFHQAGRYFRVWGNHDDEWQNEEAVREHLRPLYGGPRLSVRESLLFSVREDGRELGRLFVVHGHQGTALSDRWSRYSRLAVRHLWRPLQRALKVSLNTPAKDWRLRERHNLALYAWAAKRKGLVLIAGHTHRPVFESRSHVNQLEGELEAVESELAATAGGENLLRQAAGLAAKLEWVRAQESEKPDLGGEVGVVKPCYFNAGCCCFADGDITGVEIDRGEIRLVRWPDDEGRPRPQVLERDVLKDVLERC